MARASGRAKNPDLSGFLQVSGGAPQIPTQGGWVGKRHLSLLGESREGRALFGRGLGVPPRYPPRAGGWEMPPWGGAHTASRYPLMPSHYQYAPDVETRCQVIHCLTHVL